jgi:hypothetical protein
VLEVDAKMYSKEKQLIFSVHKRLIFRSGIQNLRNAKKYIKQKCRIREIGLHWKTIMLLFCEQILNIRMTLLEDGERRKH